MMIIIVWRSSIGEESTFWLKMRVFSAFSLVVQLLYRIKPPPSDNFFYKASSSINNSATSEHGKQRQPASLEGNIKKVLFKRKDSEMGFSLGYKEISQMVTLRRTCI